ncbi:hypothetical protein GCM10017557_40120 [Streptomyces aurantiacus]|uniref:HNH endonuclease n=2 Tax=Streptomyces aurantiacus TaxID=47760 RepID=A0A7G1P069_9ACTN|nr:hypothetical protein GCM10017557_40120 [Streptomyces aurantiacus]
MGEAAHIYAASPRGPRYNASMTPHERKSIQNGVWLCKTCAKIIDAEEAAYPPETLRVWKQHAEAGAVRDSAAAVDQTGLLLADIVAARELLLSFCEAWQRNEPSMSFEIPFAVRTENSLKYSSDRVNAYHREIEPHIARVLVIARHILGSSHQAIVDLESESTDAHVNYIEMRECARNLQQLHSILELR